MELREAFEKIKSDEKVTKEFTENPLKVLGDFGVDTANLKVTTIKKEEVEKALRVSACVSIGVVVCVSVGT